MSRAQGLFAEEALFSDGLFSLDDLRPPLPPLGLPQNVLRLQEQAGTLPGLLDIDDRYRAERRGRGWKELQAEGPRYCWSETPAGPKFDLGGDECHPAILSLDLRCRGYETHSARRGTKCSCVGSLIYRHGCAGCGLLDAPRVGENAAVEDAMDHRWDGWRDLPVLTCSMPGDFDSRSTTRTRWTTVAQAFYPPGWIEAGGPVRTARSRVGSRHVAGRTPFRGYDLGVVVGETWQCTTPGIWEAS